MHAKTSKKSNNIIVYVRSFYDIYKVQGFFTRFWVSQMPKCTECSLGLSLAFMHRVCLHKCVLYEKQSLHREWSVRRPSTLTISHMQLIVNPCIHLIKRPPLPLNQFFGTHTFYFDSPPLLSCLLHSIFEYGRVGLGDRTTHIVMFTEQSTRITSSDVRPLSSLYMSCYLASSPLTRATSPLY